MKKVAIVCNYILKPDRIGGMDRFFILFDEQLKKQGFSVDWFFTDYTAFEFYKNLNIYTAEKNLVEKKFLDISLERSYDNVITHFTELCGKFYKDIKIINPNSHVIAVDHNPRPLQGFPLKKRIKNKIKSFLYSKFINQFIAVSEYSKNHLMCDFGYNIKDKITIIHNGIDHKNYVLKKGFNFQGKFIVACHLRKEKGIQYLFKALSKLNKETLKSIRIDIYGEGPYEKDLKNLLQNYKLDKIVFFKGSVDNLFEIYNEYDYLIHPSLGETFCYSVVESLLCNLPVITTKNAGNVLGLVKNEYNGFLFTEKDDKELAKIIEDVINKKREINDDSFNLVDLPDFSLLKMVNDHINLLPQ